MALRLGKPDPDALIVAPDGSPIGQPIEDWRRACRSLGLPMVMLYALRHYSESRIMPSIRLPSCKKLLDINA